jgi:hypothetical protein
MIKVYAFDYRPTQEDDICTANQEMSITQRWYNDLARMDALFAKLRKEGMIEAWIFIGGQYDAAYDLAAS